MLEAEGQAHLWAHWPPPGEQDDAKRRFVAQAAHLDKSYGGGLSQYIRNARQLLEDSRTGARPHPAGQDP